MVTAINVQHEVGGNLAQILDSISEHHSRARADQGRDQDPHRPADA